MTEPLNIGIIVGSVREGRISRPIAKWVMAQIDARDEFDAELLDLADWQSADVRRAQSAGDGQIYRRDSSAPGLRRSVR